MNTDLRDRIGRIIKTVAVERTLESEGILLLEFQTQWDQYASVEVLP